MHEGDDFKPGLTFALLVIIVVCVVMASIVLGSN